MYATHGFPYQDISLDTVHDLDHPMDNVKDLVSGNTVTCDLDSISLGGVSPGPLP